MTTNDASPQPPPGDNQPSTPSVATAPALSVVSIGGSAGGLKALQTFFAALPSEPGVAFVVILHLMPTRESALAELLQRHTQMPVIQVTERVPLAPNHVYVIPPGQALAVQDGHLILAPFPEPHGQRAPIDYFLRTLAENHGDGAAIILSGTGSDGTLGLKAIKEGGGLILVQDPAEAEYDGMPRSAIATGLVDRVGSIAVLAEELLAYFQSKWALQLPSDPTQLSAENHERLEQILTQLRVRMGHDFSQYKRSTLLRRLGRRLQVTHTPTLAAYLAFIQHQPQELTALFQDLLISVTRFFRDPAAFAALETVVLPRLLAHKPPGEPIRVWVVGCATGEEAYSLAILLLEQAGRLDPAPEIQIFASDLDRQALQVARQGRYPASISADVTEARLARFFQREQDDYQVTSELRERILFTQHNVLHDPPFSKLDLVSCRNVLIYLERTIQTKVFDLFAYALQPAGYLFLGSAETPDGLSAYFQAVESRQRLYQQQGNPLPLIPTLLPSRRGPRAGGTEAPERAASKALIVARHVQELEAHAPPSLLIDEQDQLVYISETANRYLLHAHGPATLDVTQLIRPELQAELRTGLDEVFAHARPTLSIPQRVQLPDAAVWVALYVCPRPPIATQRLALVFFLEEAEREGATRPPDPARDNEVDALRVRMQRMQDAHAVDQEELTAANEELQSTNEEYKATLEELETGKEELQSVNEELQTLNQELRNKVEEVTQAHNDLQNLLVATEIATLFLDRDLLIRRYTPRMTEFLDVQPSDRGRPLRHLRFNLDYPTLEVDAHTVLHDLIPLECEVAGGDGRWFLVRLRPYRTLDNRIDGVVITFVDISDQKRSAQQVQAAKVYAESIVDTLHEPLLVLDPQLRVQTANPAFYTTFAVQPEASIGRYVYELGNGQWDIIELRTLLEEVLPDNQVFLNFEVTHTFEHIGTRTMLINAQQLDHVPLILLAIADITVRKAAEQQLQQWSATLETQVAERTQQVRTLVTQLTLSEQAERQRIAQVLHDELQQRLYSLQYQLKFLRDDIASEQREAVQQTLTEMEAALAESIQVTRNLNVELRPPLLAGEGLGVAIEWLAPYMRRQHGLAVKVQEMGPPPVLAETLWIPLFQIIRELLFNIVKHAGVQEAVVTLNYSAEQLEVVVTDQGQGFDVEEVLHDALSPHGLLQSRQRLELLGCHMDIESSWGIGTQITIKCPLIRGDA